MQTVISDGDLVLQELKRIAPHYKLEKLVLFGSRARGDNLPVSDYDIAVFADNMSATEQALFWSEVEDIDTLKKIDLIFVKDNLSPDLLNNIIKGGVIIYE